MQNPNDLKNLILAVTISVGLLFLWQVLYEVPRQKEAAEQVQLAQEQRVQEAPDAIVPTPGNLASSLAPLATKVAALPSREEALKNSPRIKVTSNTLHGSLSLKGARLEDLTLASYQVSQDEGAPEVVLLSPAGSKSPYFVEFGWITSDSSIQTPNADTLWRSRTNILTPKQPLILFWDNLHNVRFELHVSMDEDYLFTVDQRVINQSGHDITLYPYALINRHHPETETFYISYEGPIGVLNDTLHEIAYEELKEEGAQSFNPSKGWVGITDKYWLTAIIPPQENPVTANFNYYPKDGLERFQVDALSQGYIIPTGQASSHTTRVFAGAKVLNILDHYQAEFNIPLFDRAIDFGMLYFMTKPMASMLNYFKSFLGNFGLAILLLTVVVRLILFPLANKSYKAMNEMKRMHPEMMKIRERYSGDTMKMNQELMELYRKEKINPASGCLPLILQIPVFFALYKVLFVSIEMRHAPFYGWVQDLSAKDPMNVFTLFGTIPWNPPSFLEVGIWPILMSLTMVLQQQLNPKPADPTQAKVMAFLPYIFLFVFASFPAGLVIYWTWNNVLSILQQWWMAKRHGRVKTTESSD
jgi:YidC/Oxa1 family membrane protein insertase